LKMDVDDQQPNSSEHSVAGENPPSLMVPETSPSTASSVLIPSMKGTMTYAGGSITCKGKWAMSDASHDVPGQTSDFEFKLVKKDEACTNIFPVDGIYQGWFMLKQAPPAKGSVRIEDREIEMHFQPAEENSFKVTGHGSNKFGLFNLSGTLSELGAVHIYREYYQLTPQPVPTPTAKRATNAGRPESIQRRPSVGADPVLEATPRESSGRVRKQSFAMREYQELSQKPAPTPRSSNSIAPDMPSAPSSSIVRQASAERTHRIPVTMRKCSELLREMTKLPQARWFLEPVDHIKLGIPEYPKIIKHPMDFGTIRSKVENNEYDTIEAFAEDMRLVFRNAITFNAAKDNIVNINAREVSSKFEDRYRIIISQLEGNSFTAAVPPEPKLARSTSTASFSGSGARTTSTAASSSANKKRPSIGASVGRPSLPGPRQAPPYVPPAAVDANISQIMELQKQMQAMKEEIDRLRAQLNEKEIAKSLQESKEAAQTPLTYDEKKQLVSMVGKLPADKMDELVQIIRNGLPDEKKNDDISEVPLEILDTLTLRKLQKFVKEHAAVKKRPSSSIPRTKSEPSLKKSKKSAGGADGFGAPVATEHGDIDLFDHNELLLENEKFTAPEVQPASSVVPGGAVGNGSAVQTTTTTIVETTVTSMEEGFVLQEEDDGNEWSALG
jgi:TolA-binding protein